MNNFTNTSTSSTVKNFFQFAVDEFTSEQSLTHCIHVKPDDVVKTMIALESKGWCEFELGLDQVTEVACKTPAINCLILRDKKFQTEHDDTVYTLTEDLVLKTISDLIGEHISELQLYGEKGDETNPTFLGDEDALGGIFCLTKLSKIKIDRCSLGRDFGQMSDDWAKLLRHLWLKKCTFEHPSVASDIIKSIEKHKKIESITFSGTDLGKEGYDQLDWILRDPSSNLKVISIDESALPRLVGGLTNCRNRNLQLHLSLDIHDSPLKLSLHGSLVLATVLSSSHSSITSLRITFDCDTSKSLLDGSELDYLCAGLLNNTTLEELVLDRVCTSSYGWHEILTSVTSLSLNNNDEPLLCPLKKLVLSSGLGADFFDPYDSDNDTFDDFSNQVEDFNNSVVLDLSQALSRIHETIEVFELYVDFYTLISSEGWLSFSQGISNVAMPNLRKIQVGNRNLEKESLNVLIQSLGSNAPNLTELTIAVNNDLDVCSWATIQHFLERNPSSLKSLTLATHDANICLCENMCRSLTTALQTNRTLESIVIHRSHPMLAHTTTANFHQIWYEELSKALCNPDNMIQSNHVFQGLMLGINHPFFEATYPHRQHLIQKELWKATQDQRDGTKINHLLAINRKFGFDTETTPYHRTMAKMMHYLSEPITVGTIYSISASTNMPPPTFHHPFDLAHSSEKEILQR